MKEDNIIGQSEYLKDITETFEDTIIDEYRKLNDRLDKLLSVIKDRKDK